MTSFGQRWIEQLVERYNALGPSAMGDLRRGNGAPAKVLNGHHRFEWLYVTAFVFPARGESFWYVSNGVSKPFFEALLRLFEAEAGAGRERRIVLMPDNAGWHGEAGLAALGRPAPRLPACLHPGSAAG
jgi:hypothetical protein